MIVSKPSDAVHKAWLYRILSAVADNSQLVSSLRFKGGTCAAMQGLIKRFSVDLDFDLIKPSEIILVRKNLETIFADLGLTISDSSEKVPQYFLKYPAQDKSRSTLKIDITFPPPASNKYENVQFSDIDKVLICQTANTMFANKLVALIERYEKNRSIAGRDLFDLQSFYYLGIRYDAEVIVERRNQSVKDFFTELQDFVKDKITQTVIDQDLNSLVPLKEFQKIRKNIKNEVLMFISEEIKSFTS